MPLLKPVLFKLIATLVFASMGATVRQAGNTFPVGEIVFFRAFFAIFPVLVVYAWRRELRAVVRMGRPIEHLWRGLIASLSMYFNFTSLSRLPLVDATAIGFISPLLIVAGAALFLKEKVGIYRWSAVVVGFIGVLIMLVPHFDFARSSATTFSAVGAFAAICGLIGAAFGAANVIQTRRMTFTETTPSIVFYFSLFCAAGGLASIPLGWTMPTASEFGLLVGIGVLGGLGHIFMTESYRYAQTSMIAPLDYAQMIWAFVIGYLAFGEVPNAFVLAGTVAVAGAGIVVIIRERQLAVARRGSRSKTP